MPTLTVAISDDSTPQDTRAIRDAIAQLRGVEAVTLNADKPADRLAHARMKQQVERAIKDALDAMDTEQDTENAESADDARVSGRT